MRAYTAVPAAAGSKVVLQHVHHALGQVSVQARHGLSPARQALQVLRLLCLVGSSAGSTLLCLLRSFGCVQQAGVGGDRGGKWVGQGQWRMSMQGRCVLGCQMFRLCTVHQAAKPGDMPDTTWVAVALYTYSFQPGMCW
jgi:hypothetical protein